MVFSPPTQPSWKICEFVNLDHETSGGFGCENDKLFETTWNTSEILRSKNQKPRGFLLVLSAGGFLCLHTQRWPLRCWAALETGRSYPGATADCVRNVAGKTIGNHRNFHTGMCLLAVELSLKQKRPPRKWRLRNQSPTWIILFPAPESHEKLKDILRLKQGSLYLPTQTMQYSWEMGPSNFYHNNLH